MADKKISDFPTLPQAQDDDLLLVSSAQETYNMKVLTLKAAAEAAASAAAESAAAQAQAAQAKADSLSSQLGNVAEDVKAKVDGAYVEDEYLYLTSNGEVVAGPLGPFSGEGGSGSSGSGGGTTDHQQLTNRDTADQHPISAITGLQEALNSVPGDFEALTSDELEEILQGVISDEDENIWVGGSIDHQQLTNRDTADQHPISAITGLQAALDNIPEAHEAITNEELEAILQ